MPTSDGFLSRMLGDKFLKITSFYTEILAQLLSHCFYETKISKQAVWCLMVTGKPDTFHSYVG